jgi:hypothetical protein
VRDGENVEHFDGGAHDRLLRHDASGLLREGSQGLSLDELEDQDGRTVIGHEIVEHRDDAGMIHEVREASFAQEAFARAALSSEVPMKNLERRAPAVSMARFEHRGCAADSDEALDRPLSEQCLPCPVFGRRSNPWLPRHETPDAKLVPCGRQGEARIG